MMTFSLDHRGQMSLFLQVHLQALSDSVPSLQGLVSDVCGNLQAGFIDTNNSTGVDIF